ncbi:protein FAM110A [Rhinatrema bivittatum]|uniref:protein FAM110A n=1 Tax=Rhinatrema bivittatum TaxID=194408 RepID=UPI001129FE9E|nr:protein FAM110A [Rhinatrema bivittatum]XP_029467940.1 protein FAM110A [Rhinatrema bivittatum]XP_029467941.1 protein FAM110A [Rhinatrema bivittatum]
MPTETSHKSSSVPYSSAKQLHLLRLAESVTRKPSAVERLEADKAKYVKSKWVASTRQEPVRPQHRPLFTSVVRKALLPSSHSMESKAPRTSLNLQILHNLINVSPVQLDTAPCDGPLPLDTGTQGRAQVPAGGRNKHPGSASGLLSVRRVDVRPSTVMQPQLSSGILVSPSKCELSCVSPRKPPNTEQMSSPRKQPLLGRSKSDLSDRFSRATVDLERFFNYCGLAPEELQSVSPEHVARASSDVISGTCRSWSCTDNAGGSECARSRHSRESRQQQQPRAISIIERNARVIKWLYGLRQAKSTEP